LIRFDLISSLNGLVWTGQGHRSVHKRLGRRRPCAERWTSACWRSHHSSQWNESYQCWIHKVLPKKIKLDIYLLWSLSSSAHFKRV